MINSASAVDRPYSSPRKSTGVEGTASGGAPKKASKYRRPTPSSTDGGGNAKSEGSGTVETAPHGESNSTTVASRHSTFSVMAPPPPSAFAQGGDHNGDAVGREVVIDGDAASVRLPAARHKASSSLGIAAPNPPILMPPPPNSTRRTAAASGGPVLPTPYGTFTKATPPGDRSRVAAASILPLPAGAPWKPFPRGSSAGGGTASPQPADLISSAAAPPHYSPPTASPINQHALSLLRSLVMTPDEAARRERALFAVKTLCQHVGMKCSLYGSGNTGTTLPHSDLDIAVTPATNSSDDSDEDGDVAEGVRSSPHPHAPRRRQSGFGNPNFQAVLNALRNGGGGPSKGHHHHRSSHAPHHHGNSPMLAINEFSRPVPIAHARVPIIKAKHLPTGIDIDLSFQPDGLSSSRYLNREFARPGFVHGRPLLLLLKFFLAKWGLNDPKDGGVGGFVAALMVLWFLKMHIEQLTNGRVGFSKRHEAAAANNQAPSSQSGRSSVSGSPVGSPVSRGVAAAGGEWQRGSGGRKRSRSGSEGTGGIDGGIGEAEGDATFVLEGSDTFSRRRSATSSSSQRPTSSSASSWMHHGAGRNLLHAPSCQANDSDEDDHHREREDRKMPSSSAVSSSGLRSPIDLSNPKLTGDGDNILGTLLLAFLTYWKSADVSALGFRPSDWSVFRRLGGHSRHVWSDATPDSFPDADLVFMNPLEPSRNAAAAVSRFGLVRTHMSDLHRRLLSGDPQIIQQALSYHGAGDMMGP